MLIRRAYATICETPNDRFISRMLSMAASYTASWIYGHLKIILLVLRESGGFTMCFRLNRDLQLLHNFRVSFYGEITVMILCRLHQHLTTFIYMPLLCTVKDHLSKKYNVWCKSLSNVCTQRLG